MPGKIVIATSTFEVETSPALRQLRAEGFEIVLNPHGRRLDEAQIGALLDAGTVGLIAGLEPLTASVLRNAGGLRVISRCGVGLDNVDRDAAKALGIALYCTPEAPADSVSELTLGLMLACLRQIPRADRMVRAGEWQRPSGALLSGKQVGLLGLGRIGRRVAALCRAFGAAVLACDPQIERAESIERVALDELLARSQILSLHAPLTPQTRHLIGARALARMPRGALLINTARGELVDSDALRAALVSGHLGGAGLDVYEHEPYRGPLTGLAQVVLTPHMGSAARETRSRMELEAAENLLAGLRAGTPVAEHA